MGGRVQESQLADPETDGAVFAVHPVPSVRLNFFAGPEVLFDIDLREIVTDHALTNVFAVLTRLGTACGTPVYLSSEGDWNDVIVKYEVVPLNVV